MVIYWLDGWSLKIDMLTLRRMVDAYHLQVPPPMKPLFGRRRLFSSNNRRHCPWKQWSSPPAWTAQSLSGHGESIRGRMIESAPPQLSLEAVENPISPTHSFFHSKFSFIFCVQQLNYCLTIFKRPIFQRENCPSKEWRIRWYFSYRSVWSGGHKEWA